MSRIRTAAAVVAVAAAALLGTPLPAAAHQDDEPSWASLEIDEFSPRVVTEQTEEITVRGTVRNTSDRRINDIIVQLRRGEPVRTAREVRADELPTDSQYSDFVTVADALEPGASAPVAFTVPVSGDGSLQIAEPGVYPVLVNVNGTPDYGGQSRLTALPLLLPVLDVPGGKPDGTDDREPVDMTLLWPLVDEYPRLLPAEQGRTVLSDDELADSLTAGGRLSTLLSAMESASSATPALLSSVCFAIDPDLLYTVRLMADGYRVETDEGLVTGTGREAAGSWLQRLRTLTQGQCVFALPYADADLVALARADAEDLENLAFNGSETVDSVLSPLQSVRNVLWPAGGVVDQRTLLDLASEDPITVLAQPTLLRRPRGEAPYRIGETVGNLGSAQALPIDSLVSSLLDGSRGRADTQSMELQNGLAALVFRSAFAEPTERAGDAGDPMLITPPRRWSAPADELDEFLETVGLLIERELVTPRPLSQSAVEPAQGTTGGLDYTVRDTIAEVNVGKQVARINGVQRDLLGAMDTDNTQQVDPSTLLAPIQHGLLRASSAAWRGRPRPANEAVHRVDAYLDGLLNQVTVANGLGRPLSLASGESPIPVQIQNDLPVAITLRVRFGQTVGVQPEPVGEVSIPANSSATKWLPTKAVRTGRFSLDVWLTTPDGTRLGSTARLELTSTAYGNITLIVIGTAAGSLVLLIGLRFFRRSRSKPGGSEEA